MHNRRVKRFKSKKSNLSSGCLVIQRRLTNGTLTKDKNTNIGEMFEKQMMKDNVNGALRLLTNNTCSGILPLDDITVKKAVNGGALAKNCS